MIRAIVKLMLLPLKIAAIPFKILGRRMRRRRSWRSARMFGAGMVTGAVLSDAARR